MQTQGLGDPIALAAVEEGNHLSSGAVSQRTEVISAGAIGYLVIEGPEHRIRKVAALGNVGEGVGYLRILQTIRPPEEGNDLRSGADKQRAEGNP